MSSLYKQFGIEIMDWTYRLRTISEKLYYLKVNDDFKVDTSWSVWKLLKNTVLVQGNA